MTYEAILKAAREQDKVALHAALSNSPIDIDIRKRGTRFLTAAAELARDNEINSVHVLLSYGANKTYAAYGAALGGNKVLAESLRAQGASINLTATGAAQGGHREYAESLREQGATDIDRIAAGAAIGGYCEYAEFLRTQGASMDWIAGGAAQGGHCEYVESLREQGADIDWIANGAAFGGQREYVEFLQAQGAGISAIAHGFISGEHVSCEKSAFQLLVYINNDVFRNKLIHALKNDDNLLQETKDKLAYIQRRINHIYELKNNYAIELHQVISLQQERIPSSFLLLQLLPQLLQDRNTELYDETLPALNPAVASIIMSFIYPLHTVEIEYLNFQLTRFYLKRSIAQYCKASNWFQRLFFSPDQRKHMETARDLQSNISTLSKETFFNSYNNIIETLENDKNETVDSFIKSVVRAHHRMA